MTLSVLLIAGGVLLATVLIIETITRTRRPRTVHAVRVETIAYPTVALTCDHCGEVASATAGTPVELLAALADWQAGHACPQTTAAVPGRR